MDIFFGQFAVVLEYLTSQEKQLNKEIKLLNRQKNNCEILLNTLDTTDPQYNDISKNYTKLETELHTKENELEAINNEISSFKDNASYGGAAKIITSPKFNRNLVYNGTPQQLVSNIGYAIGGTIQFRLSTQQEYSSDIPTVTNAGSYYVYYKAIGIDGREDSEEVEINVNISKANLTIIPPTGIENLAYNGQDQKLINPNTGLVNGEQLIEYSIDNSSTYSRNIPTGQNVGSYTIYWRIYTAGIDTNNYNYSENDDNSGQINVNINKGNYNITVTVDDCIVGSTPNVIIDGLERYGIESYTEEYKKVTDPDTEYSTDVPTEIGSYIVKVQIAGNNNYNDFVKTVQFRIMSENTDVRVDEYYWYIGIDNPMDSDSISSVVNYDSTLPGWRYIGNTLGTYDKNTNKLWDGDKNSIIFPKRSNYYIALPSNKLNLYNTFGANEMENCNFIGTKKINGNIDYYIYQRAVSVKQFNFNIY